MAAPRQGRAWGLGEAVAGWVVAQVLGAVVGAVIVSAAGYDLRHTNDFPLWLVAVLQIPLWFGLLGAVLYVGHRGRGVRTEFGLRVRWPDLPGGAVAGILSQFLLVPLVSWPFVVLAGKKLSDLDKTATALTDKANDPLGIVLLVLIVAIAAPVIEELFYRGLVLGALEDRIGTWPAVVVSGLIFGASHFNMLELPALTAFGIVLAVLTVKTRRLGPSIAAHVAFNTVTVVALLLR